MYHRSGCNPRQRDARPKGLTGAPSSTSRACRRADHRGGTRTDRRPGRARRRRRAGPSARASRRARARRCARRASVDLLRARSEIAEAGPELEDSRSPRAGDRAARHAEHVRSCIIVHTGAVRTPVGPAEAGTAPRRRRARRARRIRRRDQGRAPYACPPDARACAVRDSTGRYQPARQAIRAHAARWPARPVAPTPTTAIGAEGGQRKGHVYRLPKERRPTCDDAETNGQPVQSRLPGCRS